MARRPGARARRRSFVHSLWTRRGAAAALLVMASPLAGQQRSGFVAFNGYWTAQGSASLTIDQLLNLGGGFQYFSFVNYTSPLESESPDLGGFFTEQHLRWTPVSGLPVDASLVWTARSGSSNDALLLGLRLRVSDFGVVGPAMRAARLSYSVNLLPVRVASGFDPGWAPQIEQVYRWDPIPGRLYLSGFADHNFWIGGPAGEPVLQTVTEHQVGLRLFGRVYAVTELRRNDYLPERLRTDIAFGLQYSVPFALVD